MESRPRSETFAAGSCAVTLTRDERGTLAELEGDLELASSWQIEEVLTAELSSRPDLLEVSLERLDFLDSAGLRVFLVLMRNATDLGVDVRFLRPRGAVRRTLDFAKALDYLGIDD